MMRRYMPLAIAALVFGAVIAANAVVTEAQVAPKPVSVTVCYNADYDLTGDGKVTKNDILTWLDRVEARGCPLGGAATEGCADLDVNGDGVINFEDPRTIYTHMLSCTLTTAQIAGP